jgi:hypothetical protein
MPGWVPKSNASANSAIPAMNVNQLTCLAYIDIRDGRNRALRMLRYV